MGIEPTPRSLIPPHRKRWGILIVFREVLIVEPLRQLAYTWNASGAEALRGIQTIVTWTLTPTKGGVLVRMEQSGFRANHERAYQGALDGWPREIDDLARVAEGLD